MPAKTQKITIDAIQLKAIGFAAYIYAHAAKEDRDAIAAYGGCIRIGARIGSRTQFAFMKAMENVWTAEYGAFSDQLLENEIILLENEIAVLVARLNAR